MCSIESTVTLLRVVRVAETFASGWGLVGLQPAEEGAMCARY
jgi:hypothetical protein